MFARVWTCLATLRAHRRVRRRSVLPIASLAIAGAAAGAQAPSAAPPRPPRLERLVHRSWTTRDGAPEPVRAIAQTTDGTLWLGSTTGVFRFDGARFERFEPASDGAATSRGVNALLATPDGALWMGHEVSGVSLVAGGRMVTYDARHGLPMGTVTSLALDSAGRVWAATTRSIARFVGGRWQAFDTATGFPGGVTSEITVDRRGALWAATTAGVYVLPRGAARFVRRAPSLVSREAERGSGSVRAAPDGTVWAASLSRGLFPLADSSGAPPPRGARGVVDRDWFGLHVDRHGGAWSIGTRGRLVHVPLASDGEGVPRAVIEGARTIALSREQGMSSDFSVGMLQDREGSYWVATEAGLDQFRVPKFTLVPGASSDAAPTIAPGDDGTLWIGRFRDSTLVAGAPAGAGTRARGTPATGVLSMHRDPDGALWLASHAGLWRTRGGRTERIPLPRQLLGQTVYAIAPHRDGTLWLVVERRGAFRRTRGVWERFPEPPALASLFPTFAVADAAGHTWIGYPYDHVVRVTGDSTRLLTAADGVRVGSVGTIHVRGARIWIGGEHGVVHGDPAADRIRFRRLRVAGGVLRGISGIVATADGSLWLNGASGVTHVPAVEVRRALADSAYIARAEWFDTRDGTAGPAALFGASPSAVEGTDGRLWFAASRGVAWIDPRHVLRNAVPPPVRVQSLSAGGRRYEAGAGLVRLPVRTTALDVAYTAASLAVPERVRFRYRLLGRGAVDSAWQDAGTRREAIYTNLGPGRYRFEVIAANDDGVWSTRGATLGLEIPPTFVQTRAFVALCAVMAAGGLWLLVAWRQRRVAAALRSHFAVTLAERTRVARELHDTLLGSVAGVAMQLDAAASRARSPRGLDVATLDDLRDQLRRTLVDARQAVVGMRASGEAQGALSTQVDRAAQRVFAGTGVRARVASTGEPHGGSPEVEEQVLRLATEAMTNARDHAACGAVNVTCAYLPGELRLTVRDDGLGFDPAVAGENGHFGLVGMRERAAVLGATLKVESAPGRGTTVLLVVPVRSSR